ncbi:MAG: hypothetical protein QOF51_1351 [Chloroflexota bacterium]|jgi:hypothetical protein|nr:hypothetical protein [Chloroflexota bacterium]
MIQRGFCTTCNTRRPVASYGCAVCGTPVRLQPTRTVLVRRVPAERDASFDVPSVFTFERQNTAPEPVAA